MSAIRKICGKLNIVCYLLLLFQVWHVCQYGGRRLSVIIIGAIGAALICSIIIWRKLSELSSLVKLNRKIKILSEVFFILRFWEMDGWQKSCRKSRRFSMFLMIMIIFSTMVCRDCWMILARRLICRRNYTLPVMA